MYVLIFLGSPKKNGNTALAVDMLRRELQRRRHSSDLVHLAERSIAGCRGCNACFGPKDKVNCAIEDDAADLMERIRRADAVVYASPLYAWAFPAQAKAFLDRHYCLVTEPGTERQSSLIAGKRVAMLLTCSEGKEGNADLAAACFERIFRRLKSLVIGEYVVDLSSAPDFPARASQAARTIADDLAG